MTITESTLPAAEPAPVPPIEQSAERRNPLQILLGILFKPRSTFAYLRDHGGWAWLIPLVLLIVLTLVSRPIALSIQQREMEETLAQIKQQLGDNGDNNFEIGISGPGLVTSTGASGEVNPLNSFIFTYGLPVAQAVGGWLVCALVLLGLAWVVGGRPSPSAIFRMSAWALVPFVLRILIVTIVMAVTQHIPAQGLSRAFQPSAPVESQTDDGGNVKRIVTFGPGGSGDFTGPSFSNLFVDNLLSNLDIYTVWGLLLLVVGVAVTARVSWLKGVLVTALYAVIALSLSTVPTLITFAISGLMGGGPTMIGP